MNLTEFLEDAKKVLADADEKAEQLHSAPGAAGAPQFSPGGAPPATTGLGDRGIMLASLENNRKLLEDFADASSEKRAELAATEQVRLYSIIFALYRPGPSFRVGHTMAGGALGAKISPGGQTWQEQINLLYPAAGGTFPQIFQSISRQCVRLDRGTGDISGSGFLLGDGSVLTACHVVYHPGYLYQNSNKPGYIRYNQVNAAATPEAGIVAIHPAAVEDAVRDFAVIPQSANWRALIAASPLQTEFSALSGLPIQSEPLSEHQLRNRPVAVIGHPVSGNQGGSSTDIPGVFGDAALRVKRFMPGLINAKNPLITEGGLVFINHDCSTLGGASGACLIDLQTGKVLGIHRAGSADLGNRAIPIWLLPANVQQRFQILAAPPPAPPTPEAVAMIAGGAPESVQGASTRRVIAYVMHESEEALVLSTMAPDSTGKSGRVAIEETRTMLMGDATDREIDSLRKNGILVEVLAAPEPEIALEGVASSLEQIFTPTEMDEPQKFTLNIHGPLLPMRRTQLVSSGVRIIEAISRHQYEVEVRPLQVAKVVELPFVVKLAPERTPQSFALEAVAAVEESFPPASASVQKVYDIWLRAGYDAHAFAPQLVQRGCSIVNIYKRKIRVLIPDGSSEIINIRRLREVEVMDEFAPPKLHNDRARALMGVTRPNPALPFPWNGTGEIVGIADTGIDSAHPDFAAPNKVAGVSALGRQGKSDDPHGHGTHVAGSVAGDGSASGGVYAGTAPGARIFFQSLLGPALPNNPFPLTGLPSALEQLFDEAYLAGARIHNNSWGAVAGSIYRLSSREVDEYVAEKRDMLIVISAGNEGAACDPPPPANRRSGSGFVDWYSLSAPATSKNGLTVGASQSDLTNVGYGRYTHAKVWPDAFPPANLAGEIAAMRVSGDPEQVAGFSSRGPTDTLQVKPDVVAPGTDICSVRSSLASQYQFSSLNQAWPDRYAHMCGTSMAAPLVSGCAAIVREYYRVARGYPTPSAALLKATIINGARKLTGTHSLAPPGGLPNGHQGFGRVDLANSIPAPVNPVFQLEYFDNWQETNTHLTDNTRQRFQFTLDAGAPLRICLAYTDLPGKMVQNTMVLHLHHIPTDAKYYGNEGQQESLANALHKPDRNNNVSVIRLDNPPPGNYMIQVAPQNMPFGGAQDFALVITGRITSFAPNPFAD